MRSELPEPDEGVHPFSNGSEFADWTELNCDRCVRRGKSDRGSECELEMWLARAYLGSGMVPREVAQRLRRMPEARRSSCGERELTPEWQERWDAQMAIPLYKLVRNDGLIIAVGHWSVVRRRGMLRAWNDAYESTGATVSLLPATEHEYIDYDG